MSKILIFFYLCTLIISVKGCARRPVKPDEEATPRPPPATNTTDPKPQDCRINIQQNSPNDPLVLQGSEFLYPNVSGLVTISRKYKIFIGSPGGTLSNKTGNQPLQTGYYKCAGNSTFFGPDGRSIDYNWIQCNITNITLAREAVVQNSLTGGQRSRTCGKPEEIEIELRLNRALVYTVCFNNVQKTPFYSKYKLMRNIFNGVTQRRTNLTFSDSNNAYNNTNFTQVFFWKNQRRVIYKQVSNYSYIQYNVFLNRGHLTANGDFMYRFQQYATFEYINMAPQWNQFNGGNWAKLENMVRGRVGNGSFGDVDVYTGVLGTAELMDFETGKLVPIHLEDDRGKQVNVPKWFWKVTRSISRGFDYLFLGYNNVYRRENCSAICNGMPFEVVFGNKTPIFNDTVNSAMFVCNLSTVVNPELSTLIASLG